MIKKKIDLHAPCKQTYTRVNYMSFMKVILSMEKMTRTRDNVLKSGSEGNKMKFSKQLNYWVSLLRKSKSKLFGDLKVTVKQIENALINNRVGVSKLL